MSSPLGSPPADNDGGGSPTSPPQPVAPPPPPPAPAAAPPPSGPTWEEYKERGNNYFKTKLFQQAVDSYTQAIDLKPGEAALYSNRSACKLSLKEFQAAYDDASKCVDVDPRFVKGYGRLAHAAGALGRFDVTVIERLRIGMGVAQTSGNAVAKKELEDDLKKFIQARKALEMVSEKMAANQHDQALNYAMFVCQQFPQCLRSALLRAECRAPKDPETALRELESFQGDPRTHTSDFLFVRGLASYYMGANGPKSAIPILKHVIDCDPDHARAKQLYKSARLLEQHRAAGNAAFAEKRWQFAISSYTEALAVDPSYVKMRGILLGNRSAAYVEAGELQKALADVDAATRDGNKAAKLYARRSKINERLGNLDEANQDMAKAVELDSDLRQEQAQLRERIRLAKRKDWYKILGVERNAQEADLKRAYKLQAVKWHPDKWAHCTDEEKKAAEDTFKEVGEAFAILSDPQKRQAFDSGRLDNESDFQSGGPPGRGGFQGGPDGVDVMDLFNMMMGGGGMGGGGMGGRGFRGGRGGRGGGGTTFSFH